jgi:hypothetical protein
MSGSEPKRNLESWNKNFDLNINNYSNEDLLHFFGLDENYNLENIEERVNKMIKEIFSVDNNSFDSKYKFDVINFIKTAQDVLVSFKKDMENNKEIKNNFNKFINSGRDPNVGRIINPLATHPALQRQIIPPDNIDGYNYNTTTAVYVFNTLARNDFYSSVASNSTFDLPLQWKNVISVSLSSINIPNVMFTFNKENGTNQIYIREYTTDLSGIVVLPPGNYTAYSYIGLQSNGSIFPITQASFPDSLELAINKQLGSFDYDASGNPIPRFKVSINISDYKVTISNIKYNFYMDTIIKNLKDLCSPYSNVILEDTSLKNPYDKSKLPISIYITTMGYIMGYRNIVYDGSNNYTTESIFQNSGEDYLYFVFEDYTGAQTSSDTYGIVGTNGILGGNILGVVPITSSFFSTIFDNNSNFIYKKRDYFGPVDISRISIKLLNASGNIVNLQQTDFNFSLKVVSIYDLSKKNKFNLRGSGLF